MNLFLLGRCGLCGNCEEVIFESRLGFICGDCAQQQKVYDVAANHGEMAKGVLRESLIEGRISEKYFNERVFMAKA